MLLSQTSEYAIRVMACLAMHPPENVVPASALSNESGIPPHYLSKILRKLVSSKVLRASKGHGGGFTLAQAPERVRVIDIIEAVEPPVPERHCIFGWRICNSKNPCILHDRWSKVNDAFQDWIRSTTLAEIKRGASGSGWLVRTEQSRAEGMSLMKSPTKRAQRGPSSRSDRAKRRQHPSQSGRKAKKNPRR